LDPLDIPAIGRRFHALHDRLYGYELSKEGTGLELVNIRVTALGITDKPAAATEPFAGANPAAALKGRRPVYLAEAARFEPAPVYDGEKLRHGNRLVGPAVVESATTTVLVPPGWDLAMDGDGTAVLTWRAGGEG
jgi:N-methylhydantoinase A